mmetsp:Transcript_33390/g.51225  ORF Transcript_33390/g.51225 Transcript_33390/m.51225 type:complete len:142 (+) Transcript_33390:169-594(+)|eukprot:CAMPEP_0170494036 /NCGR_PEP_ID=MMETSP0208-20121228/14406_1 /TAXON_ID=197538 /ORGANISM="Strombidium inclinatum, Strain S3" /LENGTH=141 /DNA_ID=CAMNT_0010770025 /DNA_START=78 /DNA_END=503 /DNA_ORIENTATION=-
MDRFLSSNFGEKSIQLGDGSPNGSYFQPGSVSGRGGHGGGVAGTYLSYLASGTANSIKPSVSFISMGRKEYKQTKYTDELDGPSPMQILGNEKAFKDRHPNSRTVFEKEREDHLSETMHKTQVLREARDALSVDPRDPKMA